MGVSFLTPIAALFGFLALVPLAVLISRRRRAEHIQRALGLGAGAPHRWQMLVVSIAAVPVLIGVAAAQPVVTSTRTVEQRSDAEVFVVMDTSRSMLAAAASNEPTRFDRARDDALALQEELQDIPLGIASMTDRVLPHLFPTVDRRVYRETMLEAVGIERPPPSSSFGTTVTTLDALGVIPTLAFFDPAAKKRAVVVFTDGESQPISTVLSSDYSQAPKIDVTFVRVGNASERIYESGLAEAGYEADTAAGNTLSGAATAVGGRVLQAGEVYETAATVREALGTGPSRERRIEGNRQALMPWVALLTVVPIGFVLYRRNL